MTRYGERMVLRNFWWLLIWMFLFGAISLAFIPRREEIVLGHPRIRWGKLSAAILAIPYVIWAGWRTNFYGDTFMYRDTFNNMPTGLANLGAYLATRPKGKGFVVLEYLIKTLISDDSAIFFLIIAAIQVYLLARIYRKYSENYWLSMFLFVASTDYIAWMHNGMRQFLAVTIIFAAFPLLLRRQYLLMVLVVLFASLFHTSALVFLPFIFLVNGKAWNFRTMLFILGLVISIYFLDSVTGFITDAMEDTIYEGDIMFFDRDFDNGTNIFRVLFYAVPTVLSLAFRKQVEEADDPLINLCVNLSVVSTGFYVFSAFTSGIIVGRLPIYFSLTNYILIPWLIQKLFDSGSALLIEGGFVAVYSLFFYYQAGVTWGLL